MVLVRLGAEQLLQLREHLLPAGSRIEQGAFLFCRHAVSRAGDDMFDCVDWVALEPEDYEIQSGHYLELGDGARARLIKQSHDRELCLVESHSHPGPYPAALSYSDLTGLDEFVPHVRWRLRGRPYAALVFARTGFDGLAWTDNSGNPRQVDAIESELKRIAATKLTLAQRVRSRLEHGKI